MSSLYSYNDWRDYALAHERKSQWTDDKGNNTPAYNHKYYEEHKQEIINRVKENRRNSYEDLKTEKNGYDWATQDGGGRKFANEDERRKEYLLLANENNFVERESEYGVWEDADESLKNSKDYPPEVLENIRKNNEAARENVKKLAETVQDYVKAHAGKLTNDQIATLYKDLEQQIALERKRVIDIGTGEGKKYVDDLLKSGGEKSKSELKSKSKSSSKEKTSSKSSSKSSSSSKTKSSESSTTSSTKSDSTKSNSKKRERTVTDELVEKYDGLTVEERKKKYGSKSMSQSAMYGSNDWRNYLAHKAKKGESKYDWSTGKNPPDYNHDYYEKHKEQIFAQRAKHDGKTIDEVESENVRKWDRGDGVKGVGYKAKTDDGKSYENTDDWSDELTDDEKKNIDAHNAQVDKNIEELTKSVEDYIEKNKDKLSDDEIKKLKDDLQTQIDIANEQRISTKNSDDYEYIMELREKAKGGNSPKMAITKMENPPKEQNSTPKSNSTKSNNGSSKPKSSSGGGSAPSSNLTKSGTKVKTSSGEEKEFYFQKSPDKPTTQSARDKEDEEERQRRNRTNAAGHSAITSYNDWRLYDSYLAHRMY